ncbi:urease accessory protein UreF [Leucogyrophana mollusca]|uniref:Urease accessory protein UreF n=1 Tax=Leucogyrophana mollusca TaxID=85980 RepID=A0ACB8BY97_9AGAM|nr:urease accessory protein UreF [Leucogyrophana mollusca]
MDDSETYLLLLLADSNLPTGSFVASSGFESYVKHGFISSGSATDGTINFVHDSLGTYARSALPFVSDVHRVVATYSAQEEPLIDAALADIVALDELYEAMTLNHVTKRASKSQGVALLTLYSKGFSRPTKGPQPPHEARLATLVDRLKLMIRREETHGHLPICWGVLTGALGLSLERSQFLHLFLHARSLLSAGVRLNTLGPYNAQQILLHAVRPLVEAETVRCKDLRTLLTTESAHDSSWSDEDVAGPATTWPLGEILATRHDLQHSRIFNS